MFPQDFFGFALASEARFFRADGHLNRRRDLREVGLENSRE
jgi:hypothetical protein